MLKIDVKKKVIKNEKRIEEIRKIGRNVGEVVEEWIEFLESYDEEK